MHTLNRPTDSRLMINFLHHGMYPDFIYDGKPESRGFPYRHDPNANQIGKNMVSVLKEISVRFEQSPSTHLKWYLIN